MRVFGVFWGWLAKAGVIIPEVKASKGSRFLEFHFATGSSFGSPSQQPKSGAKPIYLHAGT